MTDVTVLEPPAFCTHPDCRAKINRGLRYACGFKLDPVNGNCGRPFCDAHTIGPWHLCDRCFAGEEPYPEKEEQPQPQTWNYMLTADDWAHWRATQPAAVERIRQRRDAWVAQYGEE